jgi:phenylacetate-coenzyme A ligase PaaK-like adenylate-forming protein
MIYGANETGTMGYACEYCDPGIFHLPTETQYLEILKMDKDEPTVGEETGRLIFTGYKRENGRTERYEIGDMGHWIEGVCKCGRQQPRFKLMGRYGDVIRIGGTFFNYQRINRILSDALNYSGRLQILIDTNTNDTMTLCLENINISENKLIDILLGSDYDSFQKTIPTKLVNIKLRIIEPHEFIMNEVSLKLRPVIYANLC